GAETSVTVNYGDTLDLVIPEREHYIFTGWYTGVTVNDGKFTVITPVTKDITLVAIWQAEITYRINYVTNGGIYVAPTTHFDGDVITEFPVTEKCDYVFGGWYVDEALTTPVSSRLSLTGDMVLYARWLDVYYTVKFVTNADHELDNLSVKAGTSFDGFASGEYAHHNFVGWYTDEALTEKLIFPVEVHSDITVYAKWEDIYYILSFNTNGGSYVSSETVKSGSSVSSSQITTPVKTNYAFVGWYTDEGLSQYVSFPFEVTENVTFYAKWRYVDPYADYVKIYDGVQFQQISSDLGGKYVLMNDIDMEGVSVMQFGNADKPFTGILDGQGYTVTDFEVNMGATTNQYHGLFAQNNGSILNIKFTKVTKKGSYASGESYHGLLTAINRGTISGVSVSGTISLNHSSITFVKLYIGGICAVNNGTISDCISSGEVSTGGSGNNYVQEKIAGGICCDNNGRIINCYSNAVVSDTANNNSFYGGGICARNYGIIESVVFTGTVSGFTKHSSAISAMQSGSYTETKCYSYANVPGGTSVTVSYLNDYSFYAVTLGWNTSVWDLNNLDFLSGKYPALR
ncbi:MAG: InlB B-repeat-containing protein, partial [Clostridia bacterium]|nr:InlB B-repeat-containing protein [Clostridia bacterium]